MPLVYQKSAICMCTLPAFLDKHNLRNDRKVTLGSFVEAKLGCCRHRALVVGVLLEKFRERGNIAGHISADRNTRKGVGHAWCRFVPKNNPEQVWILDAGLGYFGRLDDKDQNNRPWDYYRPDDEK